MAVGLRSFIKSGTQLIYRKVAVLWVVIFSFELTGHILQMMSIHNHWLYNVSNIFFFCGLVYLYRKLLPGKPLRMFNSIFLVLFPVACILNSIFFQPFDSLQTINLVVGGLYTFVIVLIYLIQEFLAERKEPIREDPFFWFSLGLALYITGIMPFLGMLNYLWSHFQEFTTVYYLYVVNLFSILLDAFIIRGFLCELSYSRYS
jgi:hypothetical protein